MAITGLLLTGFVVAHLSGNLLIFAGPEAMNQYAAGLQSLGALLWIARGGLLALFVLHVWLGIRLTKENRDARPIKYAYEKTIQATVASRSMIHTGLLMLAFIIYHLAHYTFRVTSETISNIPKESVYEMMIAGFSQPLVSGFYILAMILLGLHLSHGIQSALQTFGFFHRGWYLNVRRISMGIAALIAAGFISIPVAVLCGLVQ
jgi:succinate dehydrogenase / fumarate reductase cytochrome b subunit